MPRRKKHVPAVGAFAPYLRSTIKKRFRGDPEEFVDAMADTARRDVVRVCRRRAKSSYWVRIVAPNGRTVLDSENYYDLANARRAAKRVSARYVLALDEKIADVN